jgi:hypothetical protein
VRAPVGDDHDDKHNNSDDSDTNVKRFRLRVDDSDTEDNDTVRSAHARADDVSTRVADDDAFPQFNASMLRADYLPDVSE